MAGLVPAIRRDMVRVGMAAIRPAVTIGKKVWNHA